VVFVVPVDTAVDAVGAVENAVALGALAAAASGDAI
jgi:hypothetical protein